MASTTIQIIPSDGSPQKRGTAVVADNDTINTGLSTCSGIIISPASDDVVVNATSITAGVVTVSVFAAGSSQSGNETVYWRAWNNQKV